MCLINYIKFSYTALLNSFGSRLKSLTLKTTELNPVIHILLQQGWGTSILEGHCPEKNTYLYPEDLD